MTWIRANIIEADGRFFVPLLSGFKGLPIVCCEDEVKCGTYRNKVTFLDNDDALVEAQCTGQTYQIRLDPPPAEPHCCHPPNQPTHHV